MLRRLMTLAMLGALLSATPLMSGSPAAATPCDQGTFHDVWKKTKFVFARIDGENSVYNDSGTAATYAISYGRSDSKSVTKHWEAGASAGFNWGVVRADVSGKYGESYVDAATTTASTTLTQSVQGHHTAWVRAVFYRRVVNWQAYTWRWNDRKAACVKHQIAKAYWGDPKVQYVLKQRSGHVYP
jgi:hypothetical protein